MADLKKFVEEIKTLSVMEVSELVKMLEAEFGVSAAAPVAVMAGAPQAAEEAAEEKSEFNVVLAAVDINKKIATIKVVRELTGLGLSEAKALVDNAPSTLKEAVPTVTAKEYQAKLQEVGATVELK
ncbi:MAG: 50S ribosomal protein L7/L12 [Spirochaetales bacterium]